MLTNAWLGLVEYKREEFAEECLVMGGDYTANGKITSESDEQENSGVID